MLRIPEMRLSGSREWRLPPSKSHIIRWLAMIAQSNSSCLLKLENKPGEDAYSMLNCLKEMGLKAAQQENGWFIEPHAQGLISPKITLDCGNSSTAARVLTAIAATMGEEIRIDGDESLRNRTSQLSTVLRSLNVEVDNDALPAIIDGEMSGEAEVLSLIHI